MAGIEFVEAAIELLSGRFELRSNREPQVPTASSDTSPLTERELSIVAAIQARRGVSRATAEDLVRWLRTPDPKREL